MTWIEMLQAAGVLVLGALARVALTCLALAALGGVAWLAVKLAERAHGWWRRAHGLRMVNGVPWQEGLAYAPEHEWLRAEHGRVRVGLDGIAQRVLAGTSHVSLPAEGTQLRRGDSTVEVRCTGGVVHLPAPLAGTVVAVNEELATNPHLIEGDPYRDAWLFELRTVPSGRSDLVHGTEARGWFAREASVLASEIRGGTQWPELARRFLAAA